MASLSHAMKRRAFFGKALGGLCLMSALANGRGALADGPSLGAKKEVYAAELADAETAASQKAIAIKTATMQRQQTAGLMADLQSARADVARSRGKLKTIFDQMIAQNPRDAAAYDGRANVLLKSNVPTNLDGRKLTAEDLEAKASNNVFRDAVADSQRAMELDAQNGSYPLTKSKALFELGKFDEALAAANRAVELSPTSPDALALRARTRILIGDNDLALADVEAVRKLGLSDSDYYQLRGSARLEKGDRAGALADLDQALLSDPSNARAHFNKSSLAIDNGQLQTAVTEAGWAIFLSPDYATAYANQAQAYIDLGKHADAVRTATIAIDLKPWSANSYTARSRGYNAMGIANLSRGDFNSALADVEVAIRRNGRSQELEGMRQTILASLRQLNTYNR